MGDMVQLQIFAAGCSLQSAHWGRDVRRRRRRRGAPSGLAIQGTGTAQANAGAPVTYTFTYRNGSPATACTSSANCAPNTEACVGGFCAETGVTIGFQGAGEHDVPVHQLPAGGGHLHTWPPAPTAGIITCTFTNPVGPAAPPGPSRSPSTSPPAPRCRRTGPSPAATTTSAPTRRRRSRAPRSTLHLRLHREQPVHQRRTSATPPPRPAPSARGSAQCPRATRRSARRDLVDVRAPCNGNNGSGTSDACPWPAQPYCFTVGAMARPVRPLHDGLAVSDRRRLQHDDRPLRRRLRQRRAVLRDAVVRQPGPAARASARRSSPSRGTIAPGARRPPCRRARPRWGRASACRASCDVDNLCKARQRRRAVHAGHRRRRASARSMTCSNNGTCEPMGTCDVDADCATGTWCNRDDARVPADGRQRPAPAQRLEPQGDNAERHVHERRRARSRARAAPATPKTTNAATPTGTGLARRGTATRSADRRSATPPAG